MDRTAIAIGSLTDSVRVRVNQKTSCLGKLRLITKKRGIKNYQNMSRQKLLSTLDESERIFKNLSQNRLD